MPLADIATLLIPLWILLGLLFLLGTLAILGRVQNGRYLRPIVAVIAKVPLFRKGLEKASNAAMERSNPELASAMKKMQRTGALKDPQRAQAAMVAAQPRGAAGAPRDAGAAGPRPSAGRDEPPDAAPSRAGRREREAALVRARPSPRSAFRLGDVKTARRLHRAIGVWSCRARMSVAAASRDLSPYAAR